MKPLHFFLFTALATAPITSPAAPNEGVTVTYNSGTVRFTWQSQAAWSYFVVTSPDLRNWMYLPAPVTTGNGLSQYLDFTVSGDRYFARLRLGYRPAGNSAGGDTDGDGLSDTVEIANGLDPLEIDSNGDGVADNQTPLSGSSASGAPTIQLFSPPGATQVP
jgi:hypothetical protein